MILLDTCTLLWLSTDPPRLPAAALAAIRAAPAGRRYVSAISAYEIGVKHSRGKLRLPLTPRRWFDASCAARGLSVLPITKDIVHRAIELPWHHRDPADRIIISTALEGDLAIVTPEPLFSSYEGVRIVWRVLERRAPRGRRRRLSRRVR